MKKFPFLGSQDGEGGISFWKVVLIVWVIFSVIYIVRDIWVNGIKFSFMSGYTQAYTEIVRAASMGCQPFEVKAPVGSVSLVNALCIEKMLGTQGQAPETSEVTKEAPEPQVEDTES